MKSDLRTSHHSTGRPGVLHVPSQPSRATRLLHRGRCPRWSAPPSRDGPRRCRPASRPSPSTTTEPAGRCVGSPTRRTGLLSGAHQLGRARVRRQAMRRWSDHPGRRPGAVSGSLRTRPLTCPVGLTGREPATSGHPAVGRGFARVRLSSSAQVERHTERQRTETDGAERAPMVVKRWWSPEVPGSEGGPDHPEAIVTERDGVSEGRAAGRRTPVPCRVRPPSTVSHPWAETRMRGGAPPATPRPHAARRDHRRCAVSLRVGLGTIGVR